MDFLIETVGPFAENAYVIWDRTTGEAVVIDPGDEAPRLLDGIRRRGLRVRLILATHGHLDHVGAVAELRAATGAPFHIHERELRLLAGLEDQAALFGLPAPAVPEVDGHIVEGQTFQVGSGELAIRALETPGHSPGGVTFAAGEALFVGDAVFAGSIGRTDLPGGDHPTLIRSIRERILSWPDRTILYPGHGPSTTVGEERRENPFLVDP